MQRILLSAAQKNTPRATARGFDASLPASSRSGKSPRIAHFAFGGGCRLKAVRLLGRQFTSAPLRLCANTLLCFLCCLLFAAPASAATSEYTPPPAFDSWLANLFYASGLLTCLVALWKMLFPVRKPVLEAEFVTKADLEKHCAARHGEIDLFRLEVRTQIGGVNQRIEAMRLELSSAIERHNVIDEDRAKDMHKRINPISEEATALRRSLDNHLQDHRARKTT